MLHMKCDRLHVTGVYVCHVRAEDHVSMSEEVILKTRERTKPKRHMPNIRCKDDFIKLLEK